jgi:hypothetical protein
MRSISQEQETHLAFYVSRSRTGPHISIGIPNVSRDASAGAGG